MYNIVAPDTHVTRMHVHKEGSKRCPLCQGVLISGCPIHNLTLSSPAHFFSCMYYVENFHWPPSDTDRLSYVLVTFHAAMEYIRGPDVDHLLPKDDVMVSFL